MRYFFSFILIVVLLCSGCVSTTTKVTADPGVSTTAVTDTSTPVKKTTVTIGELKAGLKYVQLSYDAINAALEKVKEYNLSNYNETIDKIQPYLTIIGTAIVTFNSALESSDDDAALNAYNLARPAIETIIKTGGPILLKYLF